MTAEWPPFPNDHTRRGRRDYSLLQWAGTCAATLEVSRRVWRGLRDRLPPGAGRRSFVVPAVAITAAFLAGAWGLKSRPRQENHKVH